MGEITKVEWSDHTFNPVIGCAKVSPGCDNCYAERMANHRGWHDWNNDTPRHVTSDAYWRQPLRWNRLAEQDGVPRRVFCASLADVFDPHWPDGVRDRLWELIEATPWLVWMLLTKRPHQVARFLPTRWQFEMPPNVWLGFTAEDQDHYDRRWPYIAVVPATVRFVSYEPALGPLSIATYHHQHRYGTPDWVICGGESGPGARPMLAAWARDLRRFCEMGAPDPIPFFFKQFGTYANNPLTATVGELEAKLRDPKTNGKGGALIDGALVRHIPHVPLPS